METRQCRFAPCKKSGPVTDSVVTLHKVTCHAVQRDNGIRRWDTFFICVRRAAGVKVFFMSKVPCVCVCCSAICIWEGRGGEKGGNANFKIKHTETFTSVIPWPLYITGSRSPKLHTSDRLWLLTRCRTQGGRLHLVENVGKIALADVTLVEDPNEEDGRMVAEDDEGEKQARLRVTN